MAEEENNNSISAVSSVPSAPEEQEEVKPVEVESYNEQDSPDPYFSLSEQVVKELKSAFDAEILTPKELDSRALDALREMSCDEALAVLKEMKVSNLEHVPNKSAFLCSLIRSQRKKSRAGTGIAENGGTLSPLQRGAGPDEEKVKELLDKTGYSLEVSAGQRKYGGPPPDWSGPPPPSGHELFCGKIPRDIFEDSLVPLFEKHGRLWDLRLMMDPILGRNRGFCFITYVDLDSAHAAVRALNNYEIRPGKLLKVNISDPNVRLFIGNLPKTKSKQELMEELKRFFEGITDVITYGSPDDPRIKNRGFAFVDFDSHRSASNARRRIMISRIFIWGLQIICDWAEPLKLDPSEEVMSKVKVLYVRNLKSEVTEQELRQLFESYGEIERIKKVKSYAFVHFVERESAVEAMKNLHGTKLLDVEIDVTLAKPLLKNKREANRGYLYMSSPYYQNYDNYLGEREPVFRNGYNGRGRFGRNYGSGDYYPTYYYDYRPNNNYYEYEGHSYGYINNNDDYYYRSNNNRYSNNSSNRRGGNGGQYYSNNSGSMKNYYYGSPNRRGGPPRRSSNEKSMSS